MLFLSQSIKKYTYLTVRRMSKYFQFQPDDDLYNIDTVSLTPVYKYRVSLLFHNTQCIQQLMLESPL